ncbi:MAG: glycosyltransferase family 2 protein [Candidatus Marinimicrobia bacterium]|jgi:hypothetical protein|nr:glycosyltransferase family 2 protein [Candidatus Neomarinimicrobiota bacterium]MDP6935880.1 glycosyltransferase family 2 protein [Candidatus Neomarinimicrobiota bacterium]
MSADLSVPLVSVVIPHYGGRDILNKCLQSLEKSTYPNLEIILVNNASPDDSVEMVNKSFPRVKIVESTENRGFSGGCNLGAKEAKGEYLLLLNNDTLHEAGWIELLVSILDTNPNIASVQPKIKNVDSPEYFDYAGACGGYMDWLCFPFARGRIFSMVEKDEQQYETAEKIFWASGTAFLTRSSVYQKLNGLDETLFAHMEEIDYHWKSQLAGFEVWVEPQSVIYHHGGATLPKSSPQKTYLNHRNSLILLLTNKSWEDTITAVFPRMILEFTAFVSELLKLNIFHGFAILRAWIWVIIHPAYLLSRRKFLAEHAGFSPCLLFSESIVLAFFLRGKKTFNELNYHPV